MGKRMTRTIRVALSVTGSAILLFSCADKDAGRASASEETMMTEYSEDLSVVMSQNGRRSYHFVTPLLEGYSLAREPYREFRKGNPDFRRHADPVDDHVCRPRIPMLVAGRAAEERGKGPQRSRKFLTRKINFPSHFLSFGLSG